MLHVQVHVHVCMWHVCMRACVHVACVHVCMCACVHVCMCACVHVCMCILHVHAHAHLEGLILDPDAPRRLLDLLAQEHRAELHLGEARKGGARAARRECMAPPG